jgi:phage FluMu protein Com
VEHRAGKKNWSSRGAEKPLRCLCGSLLARLVADGVELKCRKCKRQIVVPLLDENDSAKSEVMWK